MRFTFIHAADLHIDSPLIGLSLKDPKIAERFAHAGRRAIETLVEETIASGAAFLIIAGDIFDGDWKDVTTGLFFVRVMGALHRAGIPVFMIKGNHDAESIMSRDLPYPPTMATFAATKAETITLDALRVALHGRSFPNRLTSDFVESYPARREGWLNIGVLHTSLDGSRGHEGYAPCSVDDLKRFGYDYWALGHVHAAEVVSRDPWIVYPGNLQGRSVRETGAKGAMRVTVENGHIVDVAPIVLDSARWAHLSVDISQSTSEADAIAQVHAMLAKTHADSKGRSLAVRVTLLGQNILHNHLISRRESLEDELRAGALHLAEDCWIESLRIKTALPPQVAAIAASDEAIDLHHLLSEAADDPAFAAAIGDLVESVKAKLPKDLHDEFGRSDALTTIVSDARALLAGDGA
jgi:DNA repair exonuclease SbcCD nuclease subunit